MKYKIINYICIYISDALQDAEGNTWWWCISNYSRTFLFYILSVADETQKCCHQGNLCYFTIVGQAISRQDYQQKQKSADNNIIDVKRIYRKFIVPWYVRCKR